jgi:serine/threonine protein kinase
VPPTPPPFKPPVSCPPPDLEPGTVVAGHKILEFLGGSEWTASYKASQTSMGRTVLFKTLRPRHASDPEVKGRFFAGARSAARLNHPNLLSVFDMGEEAEVCFYTTEFAGGGTLPEYLADHDKLSSEERVAIANQIAQALAHAESEGVEQVWLAPDNVLFTEKGDVRVSHVGPGTPLSGGSPMPTMDALAGLVYLVAAGRELPSEALRPDGAWNLALPFARDAIGSKFNYMVERLITERHNAYTNTREFAAELQEMMDGIHRRGTVNAAASPGGVVPLRLERVRRREFPLKTVLIATIAASVVVTLVALGIYSSMRSGRRENEAEAIHREAMEAYRSPDSRLRALGLFQRLANEFPDTEYGKKAKTGNVSVARDAVVNDALAAAYRPFEADPSQIEAALAAIIAARSQIENVVGSYPGLDKLEQYHKKRAYEQAASKELQEKFRPDIKSLCSVMHYGAALAKVEEYRRRWPDSDYVQKQADSDMKGIKKLAKDRFEKLMKEAEAAQSQGLKKKAQEILDKIIRNFGIPEYVEKARARRN